MMTTIPSDTIYVETSRFGPLSVAADLVITLPDGMIGFDDCRRYVVLHQDPESPFRWFQSLDDGAVAFPVVDPAKIVNDYAPSISDTDARLLGLAPGSARLIFVVVTVPRGNPRGMTANLLAPIVINPATQIGRQAIVESETYTTRHRILGGR